MSYASLLQKPVTREKDMLTMNSERNVPTRNFYQIRETVYWLLSATHVSDKKFLAACQSQGIIFTQELGDSCRKNDGMNHDLDEARAILAMVSTCQSMDELRTLVKSYNQLTSNATPGSGFAARKEQMFARIKKYFG